MEQLRDIQGIAAAKGEMLEVMGPEGLLVFNSDDPIVRELAKGWKGPSWSFGTTGQANVRLLAAEDVGGKQRIVLGWDSHTVDCVLQVAGIHNRNNALAAAAIAKAMDADPESIHQGLSQFRGVPGRFTLWKSDRFTVIDDSYNANPRSMECALENLMHMSEDAPRIAVLGDMLELGSFSREAHRALGNLAARCSLSYLGVMGQYAAVVREGAIDGGMRSDQILVTQDPSEVAQWISRLLTGGEWILIKGSRGMQMERVIQALEAIVGCRGSG
jgi:UDP-N-acetylmuramoyl-tripeptide--D-alanyl-D-alanine ligase